MKLKISILIFLATLCLLPNLVRADNEYDNYTYLVNQSNEIILTGVIDKTITSANVPSKIDGKNVVELDETFYECENLKSVNLPNGLKTIGNLAFAECESLESIDIPATATYISDSAFECCEEKIVLVVEKDSDAEAYAIKNNMQYRYKGENEIHNSKQEDSDNLKLTYMYPNNYDETSDNFKTTDRWTLYFKDLSTSNISDISFYYENKKYIINNWSQNKRLSDNNEEYYEVNFALTDDLINAIGGIKDDIMPRCYLDLNISYSYGNGKFGTISYDIYFLGKSITFKSVKTDEIIEKLKNHYYVTLELQDESEIINSKIFEALSKNQDLNFEINTKNSQLIINSNNITNTSINLNPQITISNKKFNEIKNNSAQTGIFVKFEQEGILPGKTDVYLDVGELIHNYHEGQDLFLYYYNLKDKKYELISKAEVDPSGWIIINSLEHGGYYVLLENEIKQGNYHTHNLEFVPEVKETCTNPGNKAYYKCTDCDELFTDSKGINIISNYSKILVPAKGHNFQTITKKATLSKDGSVITKCSICGKVKSTIPIYHPKTISLSKTLFTYNNNILRPMVLVKDYKGKVLKENTDYTIYYSNKNSKKVGEYSIKVTFKGNYEEAKTLKYTIVPKGISLNKLIAGNKQFKATWSKQTAETTGYEIQYSTKKDFSSGNKTITITKNKITSKTVKKLKNKKKYFIRIRTYKAVRVNGKITKIYSNWSSIKNVKTK